MESLYLNLDTPLWTGNAVKESRHVEPRGLVGTLRWWYEAMIRGCGGWACDPSDPDTRCQLDGDAFAKQRERGCDHAGPGALCPTCQLEALAASGLCSACQLFGATGWAKRVLLSVVETHVHQDRPFGLTHTQVDADRNNRRNRSPRYFFPQGLLGQVELRLMVREAQKRNPGRRRVRPALSPWCRGWHRGRQGLGGYAGCGLGGLKAWKRGWL